MYISRQEQPRAAQIFKRLPRRRNFSTRNSHPEKYILEGETREIGQVITSKNPQCNTSIVTFKFTELPVDTFSHKMMSPSRIDLTRRRNASKDMYLHTVRPMPNLAVIRVSSCEVQRLQSEICNRRSCRKMAAEQEEGCDLEVQGVGRGKASSNETAFASRGQSSSGRMRMTAASFRVKSHQAGEMGNHANSVELAQFLRRPNFKKDHFVFSMAEKTDTPDTRIELFRDFLWKVNYSNGIFAISPAESSFTYKAFIGKGNNSVMVKGILRHRSWWTIVDDPAQANFVWTQLKINTLFEAQPCRKVQYSLKEIYSQADVSKESRGSILEGDDAYGRLFNVIDLRNWQNHLRRNIKTQEKLCSSTYMKRVGLLNRKKLFKIDNPSSVSIQNHLTYNYYIGNKKALFYNLKRYYQHTQQSLADAIPLTFHLSKGTEDQRYAEFYEVYQQLQEQKKTDRQFRNIWIMKPGESTNRGQGITVCFSLDDALMRLRGRERNKDGSLRTFILQKYMEKPLLYQGRKFDLRHYMLVTCIGGTIRGYWYSQGYVRTSSSPFSLKNPKDLYVHLTNDAVQKYCDSYGKYEPANKLSYEELEKYIAKVSLVEKSNGVSFTREILPRMRAIALDALRSTYHMLDPTRRHHNFQLLGLDFMIDQNYRPLLIEVNTNPCLELSCPLLETIIPPLIQNTLKLCVDPLFPPPEGLQAGKKTALYCENHIQENKFQLFFDELLEGEQLRGIFQSSMGADMGNIADDDSEFDNDGPENWEEKGQQ